MHVFKKFFFIYFPDPIRVSKAHHCKHNNSKIINIRNIKFKTLEQLPTHDMQINIIYINKKKKTFLH